MRERTVFVAMFGLGMAAVAFSAVVVHMVVGPLPPTETTPVPSFAAARASEEEKPVGPAAKR